MISAAVRRLQNRTLNRGSWERRTGGVQWRECDARGSITTASGENNLPNGQILRRARGPELEASPEEEAIGWKGGNYYRSLVAKSAQRADFATSERPGVRSEAIGWKEGQLFKRARNKICATGRFCDEREDRG